jgi:hypothetical protein
MRPRLHQLWGQGVRPYSAPGAPKRGFSGLRLLGWVAALAALAAWLLHESNTAQPETPRWAAAQPASGVLPHSDPLSALAPTAAGLSRPPSALSDEAWARQQAQRRAQEERLHRAEQTLQAYQQVSRYPFDSRPLAEHPDQIRPFDPIEREAPARAGDGKPIKGVRLRLVQDRVFASGDETVGFQVAAFNDEGKPLPMRVSRAVSMDMPEPGTQVPSPPVPLEFNDTARAPDTRAGDGLWSGQLQPARQGYAQFAGTLRVVLELVVDGQAGGATFDVLYDPMVPARWAGPAQDALSAGSLDFKLKAHIHQAGRYVVTGRVFDAQGKAVALVQFNQELREGSQEIKLPLFGKLVHDLSPAFPLALRDVQGFLLRERHPDRAMMPRWPGVVHQTASYPLSAFSKAEWSSEERDRYLAELARDVERARSP